MGFCSCQVEREKRKAAAAADAQKRANAGGSWLGWLTGSSTASARSTDSTAVKEGGSELSEEELAHLRGLVTEQEDAMDVGAHSTLQCTAHPVKDM